MDFRENTLKEQTLCLAIPKGLIIFRFVRVLSLKLCAVCQFLSLEDKKGNADTEVVLLMLVE